MHLHLIKNAAAWEKNQYNPGVAFMGTEHGQQVWPKGIKKTKQRENVLAILKESARPVTAADIYQTILQGGDSSVWMSTVYRTLELFVLKGMVIKTNLTNSETAVYELNRSEHKHYAVCVNCHKIITIRNCPIRHDIPELEESDFYVTGHHLEIFGLCRECRMQ